MRQVGDGQVRFDVAHRPAHVGRDQVEDLLRRRREAANPQVAADHDDRDIHADQQIDQVVVHPRQLGIAVPQLVVDRDQLFVSGLRLFLGHLQLFVGALELFIGRKDFLVGAFQFLVGVFVLLDDRLQVLADAGQLLLKLRNLLVGSGGRRGRRCGLPGGLTFQRRHFLKEDEEKRHHFHTRQPRVRAVGQPHAFARRKRVLGLGLVEGGAHLGQQPLAEHAQQVEAGSARGGLQVRRGPPAELHHRAALVHDHAHRGISAQHDAVGFFLHVQRRPERSTLVAGHAPAGLTGAGGSPLEVHR